MPPPMVKTKDKPVSKKKGKKITHKNIKRGMTVLDESLQKEVMILGDVVIKNYKYYTWGTTTGAYAVSVDYEWDEDYKNEYPELTEVKEEKKDA